MSEAINGLNIDYTALGKGMYDLFDEYEQAIVAFGMIPKDKMDIMMEQFKDKCARLQLAQWRVPEDDTESFKYIRDHIKKSVLETFEREMCIAIYQAASNAGKMRA